MNYFKDEEDGSGVTAPKLGPSIGYLSPLADFSEPEANDLYTRRETPTTGGKWPFRNIKVEREETKPYSRPPESRRKYFHENIDLPKELKELFAPLKCNLCNCEMPSPITAKCHYSGKKHIANIKKWFSEHPDFIGKYKIPECNKNASIDPEKLYCKYCDITLSSEQQAEAHYAGKKHQDVINNKMMKNAYFNTNTGQWERCDKAKEDKTGRFGIGLAFVKPIGEDPKATEQISGHRFFCETCRVACPSLISLNDHFSGAKHKKKMAALTRDVPPPAAKDNILETVIKCDKKTPSPSDLSIYRTPSGKYYCQPCDVTVNSPAQFVQHSESKKHKHKITTAASKPK